MFWERRRLHFGQTHSYVIRISRGFQLFFLKMHWCENGNRRRVVWVRCGDAVAGLKIAALELVEISDIS